MTSDEGRVNEGRMTKGRIASLCLSYSLKSIEILTLIFCGSLFSPVAGFQSGQFNLKKTE